MIIFKNAPEGNGGKRTGPKVKNPFSLQTVCIWYFFARYYCFLMCITVKIGNKFREMIIFKNTPEVNGGKRRETKVKTHFRYKLYVFRIFLHVTTVF